MTKLEKALENIEDVKRVLIQEFCPAFFGLKNNCNIARDCEKCWNQEADEMTHTPEKWYVGYGHVFTVTGEDQVEIIAEHIRDEKTAHQIKAIPDMLEALEGVVALTENIQVCPFCGCVLDHRPDCLSREIESAIRKARGEE